MRIMTGWRENNLGEFLALNFKRNSNNLLNLKRNSASFKINSRKIAEKFVNFKINSQIFAEFFCNLTKNSHLFINFYGFFATLKMTKCRKTQAPKKPKNSQKSVNFYQISQHFFNIKKASNYAKIKLT